MNATRLSEVLLMHGKEQWRLFLGNFFSGSHFLNSGSSVCIRQRKSKPVLQSSCNELYISSLFKIQMVTEIKS